MVRAAELQPDERVLELGAGMGRFSRLLAQRPGGVTAVELSPELAAICAQTLAPHPESRVLVSDATTNLPAIPGGFDLVAGFFFYTTLKDLRGGETTQNPLDSLGSFFKHAPRNSWRMGCVS
jgi:16S rRNA (adenine1518-N6/adenine1519-N6)-dimethyltransferase